VYQPNPVGSNPPVTIGHHYSVLAFLPKKGQPDALPWVGVYAEVLALISSIRQALPHTDARRAARRQNRRQCCDDHDDRQPDPHRRKVVLIVQRRAKHCLPQCACQRTTEDERNGHSHQPAQQPLEQAFHHEHAHNRGRTSADRSQHADLFRPFDDGGAGGRRGGAVCPRTCSAWRGGWAGRAVVFLSPALSRTRGLCLPCGRPRAESRAEQGKTSMGQKLRRPSGASVRRRCDFADWQLQE
jgi:hypothetical protein